MAPTKRLSYTEDRMKAACHAVKVERKSIRRAALLYGVPLTTLRGRLKGICAMHETWKRGLAREDEKEILDWIDNSRAKGIELSRNEIRATVQTLLNTKNVKSTFKDNLPSSRWVQRLLRRRKKMKNNPCANEDLNSDGNSLSHEDKLRAWFSQAYSSMSTPDNKTILIENSSKTDMALSPNNVGQDYVPVGTMTCHVAIEDDRTTDMIQEVETININGTSSIVVTPPLDLTSLPDTTTSASLSIPQPSAHCLIKTNSGTSIVPPARRPCIMSSMSALDKLLELAAKVGIEKVIHYRSLYALRLQKHINDPEGQEFCWLYHNIVQHLEGMDGANKDPRVHKSTQNEFPLKIRPTKVSKSRRLWKKVIKKVSKKKKMSDSKGNKDETKIVDEDVIPAGTMICHFDKGTNMSQEVEEKIKVEIKNVNLTDVNVVTPPLDSTSSSDSGISHSIPLRKMKIVK